MKKTRARYARALIYAEVDVLTRAMCFVDELDSYHCVQKVDICISIVASRTKSKEGEARGAFFSLPNALQSLSFCKRKVEDGRRLNREFYRWNRVSPKRNASLNDPAKRSPVMFCLPQKRREENSMKPYVMNDVIGLSA